MSSDGYVDLRDGPVLPTEALWLAVKLESRGHTIGVKDGKLTVSDGSKLTDVDRAAIKQWRLHLMAFVEYCEKGVVPR